MTGLPACDSDTRGKRGAADKDDHDDCHNKQLCEAENVGALVAADEVTASIISIDIIDTEASPVEGIESEPDPDLLLATNEKVLPNISTITQLRTRQYFPTVDQRRRKNVAAHNDGSNSEYWEKRSQLMDDESKRAADVHQMRTEEHQQRMRHREAIFKKQQEYWDAAIAHYQPKQPLHQVQEENYEYPMDVHYLNSPESIDSIDSDK